MSQKSTHWICANRRKARKKLKKTMYLLTKQQWTDIIKAAHKSGENGEKKSPFLSQKNKIKKEEIL